MWPKTSRNVRTQKKYGGNTPKSKKKKQKHAKGPREKGNSGRGKGRKKP